MSAQLLLAAIAINNGNHNAAAALLTLIRNRVDGISPPPDWMNSGSAKTMIQSDVQSLLILLDLIS
jgi:hypothetical protein